MATFNKGILGAFSGKVGPIVGATWRGKNVMRSMPRKSKREQSLLQKLQREKFTLASQFMFPISKIYGRYFGTPGTLKTQKNQATSYLMKEAIANDGVQVFWDYSKILITRGDLLGLNAVSGVAGTNHDVDVTWTNNSGQGNALATDKVLAVVYEETSNMTWSAEGIATRDTEAITLPLPANWSGMNVHVWVAIVAADDGKYATSQYLGLVTLS